MAHDLHIIQRGHVRVYNIAVAGRRHRARPRRVLPGRRRCRRARSTRATSTPPRTSSATSCRGTDFDELRQALGRRSRSSARRRWPASCSSRSRNCARSSRSAPWSSGPSSSRCATSCAAPRCTARADTSIRDALETMRREQLEQHRRRRRGAAAGRHLHPDRPAGAAWCCEGVDLATSIAVGDDATARASSTKWPPRRRRSRGWRSSASTS